MTVYGIEGYYDNGLEYEDNVSGHFAGEVLYMNEEDALSVLKDRIKLTKLFCESAHTSDFEFYKGEHFFYATFVEHDIDDTGYEFDTYKWTFTIKEFTLQENGD